MSAIISKNIFFFVVFASVIFAFHACKNKESAKENTVLQQKIESNAKSTALENALQTEINLADIQLVLADSVISKDLKSSKMTIVNNSDYTLSTGSPYLIKYLEFGFYGTIPAIKNAIWTDIEYIIKPKSAWNKEFIFDYLDFDFSPGKYRIEKNIQIVNPDYKDDDQRSLRYLGERTLVADFEIK